MTKRVAVVGPGLDYEALVHLVSQMQDEELKAACLDGRLELIALPLPVSEKSGIGMKALFLELQHLEAQGVPIIVTGLEMSPRMVSVAERARREVVIPKEVEMDNIQPFSFEREPPRYQTKRQWREAMKKGRR